MTTSVAERRVAIVARNSNAVGPQISVRGQLMLSGGDMMPPGGEIVELHKAMMRRAQDAAGGLPCYALSLTGGLVGQGLGVPILQINARVQAFDGSADAPAVLVREFAAAVATATDRGQRAIDVED